MNKVDLLKCPECKGSGKSGQFDRCIPPNEYECEVCNGTGYKICCGDYEVFNAHKECYASYIKNDDGMKKEYDFSNAEKGKFYFGDDR